MSFVFDNAKYFGGILNLLRKFKDEVHFKIDSEGLHVKELDTWHVAMIVLDVPKHCFLDLKVPEEKMICLNLKDLVKIFKKTSKNDLLTWKTEEDHVTISFRGEDNINRSYKIPLIKAVYEDLPIPEVKNHVEFTIDLPSLRKILESSVNDEITLTVDPKRNLKFTSKDEEDIEYSVEITPEDLIEISRNHPQKNHIITSTYKIEYLLKYVKALQPLARNVTISFTSDSPMKLTCKFRYEEKATIYLAPYQHF